MPNERRISIAFSCDLKENTTSSKLTRKSAKDTPASPIDLLSSFPWYNRVIDTAILTVRIPTARQGKIYIIK